MVGHFVLFSEQNIVAFAIEIFRVLLIFYIISSVELYLSKIIIIRNFFVQHFPLLFCLTRCGSHNSIYVSLRSTEC